MPHMCAHIYMCARAHLFRAHAARLPRTRRFAQRHRAVEAATCLYPCSCTPAATLRQLPRPLDPQMMSKHKMNNPVPSNPCGDEIRELMVGPLSTRMGTKPNPRTLLTPAGFHICGGRVREPCRRPRHGRRSPWRRSQRGLLWPRNASVHDRPVDGRHGAPRLSALHKSCGARHCFWRAN